MLGGYGLSKILKNVMSLTNLMQITIYVVVMLARQCILTWYFFFVFHQGKINDQNGVGWVLI